MKAHGKQLIKLRRCTELPCLPNETTDGISFVFVHFNVLMNNSKYLEVPNGI